jgi:hypothetical protein
LSQSATLLHENIFMLNCTFASRESQVHITFVMVGSDFKLLEMLYSMITVAVSGVQSNTFSLKHAQETQ